MQQPGTGAQHQDIEAESQATSNRQRKREEWERQTGGTSTNRHGLGAYRRQCASHDEEPAVFCHQCHALREHRVADTEHRQQWFADRGEGGDAERVCHAPAKDGAGCGGECKRPGARWIRDHQRNQQQLSRPWYHRALGEIPEECGWNRAARVSKAFDGRPERGPGPNHVVQLT